LALRRAWLAALCLAASQAAGARPYGIDDVLALEGYGKAVFAPDGHWAAIEKLRPYGSGPTYIYDGFTGQALRQVMRVDLDGNGGLVPLFPQDKDAAYWMGTPSRSGDRLTVFRLRGASLTLGIAQPAKGIVEWLDVVPATPLLNPHPAWIDETNLLALTLVGRSPGYPLDIGMRLQQSLLPKWDQTAQGRTAGVSALSSLGGQLRPTARLERIDLETGARRVLAEDRIVDLALSADRKWAAITVETALARPDPKGLVTSADLAFKHSIRVINLATGQSTDVCGQCDTAANLMAWSPTGAKLLFYRRTPDAPWPKGTLMLYEAGRRIAQPALASGVEASSFIYGRGEGIVTAGWLDKTPLLLGTTAQDPEARWYGPTGVHAALSFKDCKPKRIGFAAKGPMVLCNDMVRSLSKVRLPILLAAHAPRFASAYQDFFGVGVRATHDPVERADAIAIASMVETPRAWWVDGQTAGPPIALPPDTDRFLGGPANGPVLSITRGAHGIGGLWLSVKGQPPRMIDAINVHLTGIDWPQFRRIKAPGGDNDWLVLPAGADKARKLPLVVIAYPGTTFDETMPRDLGGDNVRINTNALLLAAAGYAVLLPSMGEHRHRANPIDGMGAEVEAAADRAIATGLIDPERMVVYGHSYGGYAALAVAGQSQRFAGYIASSAPINLFGSYGEFIPYDRIDLEDGFPQSFAFGWYETSQGALGGPPWVDPAHYAYNSPLLHLDHIDKPVLLIGGDLDYASVSGAERLYAGLYRLGRDATLVRYWGEGHLIQSPSNMKDLDKRIRDWLNEKLGSVSSNAPPKVPAKQASPRDRTRRAS
jgi:acetyl esterase/lipase